MRDAITRAGRPAFIWNAAVALAIGFVVPTPCLATQDASGADTAAGPLMASRASLESRLEAARLMGEEGLTVAEAIERRLGSGDFGQGDRVILSVEGEPAMSDTFSVGPDRGLVLPAIGAISLRGVLRSELQAHMTREIGRYIREPVVHARALVGLTVTGEVARAGFHWVPSDGLVADVLNAAGGGTRDAKLEEMRIDRNGRPVVNERGMQSALANLSTLDDVGIRPGDQLVVPSRRGASTYEVVRTVSIILTIPITIFALTQIFK